MIHGIHTWLIIVVCAFIGATYVLCAKLLTFCIDPLVLTFLRCFFSLLFFLPCIKAKDLSTLSRYDALTLAIGGIFGICLSNVLYFISLKSITALEAALINALVPFFLLLITHLSAKTVPSAQKIIAFTLGLIGAYLLITNGNFHCSFFSTWGELVMLVSVFCWVIYSLAARLKQSSLSSTNFTFGTLLIGMLALAPFAVQNHLIATIQEFNGYDWLLLIYIGLIATGLGYYLYTKAIERCGADDAAYLVYSITPILVLALTALLYGQSLSQMQLVGTLCTIIGLLLYAL